MGSGVRASAVVLALLGASACGAPVQVRGHVAADGRLFFMSPRYVRQAGGSGGSIVAEPELSLQTEDTRHTLTARPFARLDMYDPRRTHFDVRQGDYVFSSDEWELAAGAGLFTWGVLEGNRLVDIVNQRDLVEDIDGSQKLGQTYASVGLTSGAWSLKVLYLPYTPQRTFPGTLGRLRAPAVIDTANPEYETVLGAWHPTAAIRATFAEDEWDLGFAIFSGVGREPRFLVQLSDDGIVPSYPLLQQASFDAQWTHEALILKLEAAARLFSTAFDFSWAVAGGLEYNFWDVEGSGVDLTVVAEYNYDWRPEGTPFTFFQNDVFAGFRLAFNDEGDTEVRGGTSTDLGTGFTFVSFQAERRLSDHFKLGLQMRFFLGPEGPLESAFRRDHYGQLRLAYHF